MEGADIMARDNKNKESKSEGNGLFSELFNSLFDQGVDEYIRPVTESLINQMPIGLLQSAKSLGIDKLLSTASVLFSTFAKRKKFPLSDKLSDIVREFSAETKTAINRKLAGETLSGSVDGKVHGSGKTEKSGKDKIISFFLDPEFINELETLFSAYVELLKDAKGNDISEKEREKIDLFLSKMDSKSLYSFFLLEKTKREMIIKDFVEKVELKKEDSIEESIKEIKKKIREAKKVYKKCIRPEIEKFDEFFADDSEIGKKTQDLLSWSKRLRKKAKKLEKKSRG